MLKDKEGKIVSEEVIAPPAVGGELKPESGVEPKETKKFERQPFERRRMPRRSGREDRVKPEFDQKILNIRRVARVTAGGKRFNLSVAMAIGNRRGSVGVGTGKGLDTALAIEKAMRDAKKQMIRVNTTKEMSIPHRVEAKDSSAIVVIMPAPRRGLVAGSALRDVLDLAGLKDVNAKILSGSKNKLNIARAAIKALKMLKAARSSD
jgi:small subunit ribosomal protein S5